MQYDKEMTERDFVGILRDELVKPYLGAFLDTLSADGIKEVRYVMLQYQLDIKQNYLGCTINMPGGLFDRYPQLEPMFYAWTQGMKRFDFTKFKIKIGQKEKFGYGELTIAVGYYTNWLERTRKNK